MTAAGVDCEEGPACCLSMANPSRFSSISGRQAVPILMAVGGIAATVAIFALAGRVLSSRSFVDRVVIVNPTLYQLEIDVVGADRSHGVGLGTVEREDSTTFEDVIDQGAEWVFRFESGGYDGGEARITRERLEGDGWQFTVPAEVGRRLEAAGLAPSPARPR